MNSFIFTDNDSLSLSIANKAYNVDASHSNWEEILNALRNKDFESIPGLINIAKAIQAYVGVGLNNIVVNEDYGTITYAGQPVHGMIVDRIMKMRDEGFDINPMLAFLDNLMDNPSKRAVDELYGFLQYGKLPITPDGFFIAYKRVRADYKSVYDGKTDNSIGATVSMPRNLVNENSQQTCSDGLHFCSHEYLKSFSGERIIVLKINPRDVVSIPADYNNTKGRACSYDVIGELTKEEFEASLNENIFKASVHGVKPTPKVVVAPAVSGAKTGSSSFFVGYDQGYADGITDKEWDDGNNYPWNSKDEKNFEEGYAKGYSAGELGDAAEYAFVDPSASDEEEGEVGTDTYIGYDIGYRAGRGKKAKPAATGNVNYDKGAVAGYADGKGHKSRQY
jgi:hypothetical protein